MIIFCNRIPRLTNVHLFGLLTMPTPEEEELNERFSSLTPRQQRRILQYARVLSEGGVPGRELLEFAGRISADDAREIAQAIADGCEGVDERGW